MEAKLHLIKGNPKGKQVEIPSGTLTVGRAEDSDLIIASTRVSRHHCEIVSEGGKLTIRDKGSGNGTFVNGAKIEEQALDAGDEVRIGPLTFVLEIDGVRDKPAKPAARQKPAPAPKPKAPKPKAARPKAPVPAPKPRGSKDDILASLERLAGGGDAGGDDASEKDDVLEISDDDLLDD
ncbi:MAG TPA: FHA domain-containing protein [Phycisphaerae bacterium]|nr:FHA domain-containing protein [Phycisphaerae bacterium]